MNKNMNIFYSVLCGLLIQICEWGTRASYFETCCNFFFRFFFFQSDQPTQYQETQSTLNAKKGVCPKLNRDF